MGDVASDKHEDSVQFVDFEYFGCVYLVCVRQCAEQSVLQENFQGNPLGGRADVYQPVVLRGIWGGFYSLCRVDAGDRADDPLFPDACHIP